MVNSRPNAMGLLFENLQRQRVTPARRTRARSLAGLGDGLDLVEFVVGIPGEPVAGAGLFTMPVK